MAILGHLIARSLYIRKRMTPKVATPIKYQTTTLKKLLTKSEQTLFGKHYKFSELLSSDSFIDHFRNTVPVHTYNEMYDQWWHKCQEGIADVSWPGKVKYFALSSGTSESASKHIPVTQDMIKSIKRVGFKQLCSLTNFDIPSATFQKGVLMLGGTTSLFEKGEYYEGDMSGISAKNMPRWMSALLYKPGKKIAKKPKWEDRIKLIVRNAKKWDVGTVCGVPAWVQIVFEEIIKYHKLNTIHDIWPNLNIYIHGGVSFEPYKDSFSKLLAKPISFVETYMASEGSFGFKAHPNDSGIKLVLNAGIFYEFVPFNASNFDEEGNPYSKVQSVLINEVDEQTEYAVMLSTCSGAWRYIIGDVIRFTNAKEHEMMIVGRTKQFLSLCGEHLSVDNMNKAIEVVAKQYQIAINEFTVIGFSEANYFAHRWYIGCDDKSISEQEIAASIDKALCELNDDYEVERTSALKSIYVTLVPNKTFYDYMKSLGKDGAMNKFPRVLKGNAKDKWEAYLNNLAH